MSNPIGKNQYTAGVGLGAAQKRLKMALKSGGAKQIAPNKPGWMTRIMKNQQAIAGAKASIAHYRAKLK